MPAPTGRSKSGCSAPSCARSSALDVRVGVDDLVAAEQEAQRDEQTARRDERDHVADAGEQPAADLGGARARHRRRTTVPPTAPAAAPATRRPFGSSAAASASRIITSGSLIARLVPRLRRPACRRTGLVLHADVDGEDHGVGGADDGRVERGGAGRALGLDVDVDAGRLARGGPACRRPCRCARCRSGRR